MKSLHIPHFSRWLILLLLQSQWQLIPILRECEAAFTFLNESALRNTSDSDLDSDSDFEGGNKKGNGEEMLRTLAWLSSGIVPQIIDAAPWRMLTIQYGNEMVNTLGQQLTTMQTRNAPIVSYQAHPWHFYTLSMVDPDASSEDREVNHWLVVNIPGAAVERGDVLTSYLSPAPPQGEGFHRYIFLVFKQPGKFPIQNPGMNEYPILRFSIQNFARQYRLGKPQFGNFFMAQYAGS